ncbi:TPA: LPXTG cell wall anchor domain-containing protein [Streptococcus suis]
MHAKKLVKWGVALTSTLVLGGVVGTEAGQLLGGSNVVYAQEWRDVYLDIINIDQDGNEINRREVVVGSGETVTILMEAIPGYRSNEQYSELTISYMEVVFLGPRVPIYNRYVRVETPSDQPTDQPAETPTEKPVEQPVEQPTEKPAEVPVEQPVETPAEQPVFHPYVVEFYIDGEYWGAANRGYNSGWPYVRLAPYSEEFPGKEWPKEELDGHTSNLPNVSMVTKEDLDSIGGVVKAYWTRKPVEQPAEKPVDQPVEQPVETLAGQPTETPADQPVEQPAETSTAKPVETPAGQPTETPVEKPVETPTDQPVEQPVETSTDQPTEKPTVTSLLAGNTTSKAQTVATTDKKKVDNSTPSTNTVKPEEGSQATAKTLPKTGDSGSMLLVLGGLLSGLSGLGLAATSRKRD